MAGLVPAIAATAALAAGFFDTPTVGDHLGSTGKTFHAWGGPGAGAGGVDLQHLSVFARKAGSGRISGTVTFASDHSLPALVIQRAKCEVRDPTATTTWTVLSDITVPDSRISNEAPLNRFSDSFQCSDATSGMEFRLSIWDDAGAENPRFVFHHGFTRP